MIPTQVNVNIKIRHDLAINWTTRNPVLLAGEFGLEDDTLLIKVGNGNTQWNNLSYINKLHSTYFTKLADGSLTFSESFQNQIQQILDTINAPLVITNDPVAATDPANKRYVDAAIAAAGLLRREIVNSLPSIANANAQTIYMVLHDDKYDEYMLIDGAFAKIGSSDFDLNVASAEHLGGVKSSTEPNHIAVGQDGFMTLNRVSTSLLYVPNGDDLVINGGTA